MLGKDREYAAIWCGKVAANQEKTNLGLVQSVGDCTKNDEISVIRFRHGQGAVE